MSPLGVYVTASETPQSGGVASLTGQAFVVAEANYGPEEPKLIRSLNELVLFFGPRESGSTKLYDSINAFFALGGARAYISRIGGEGSPAAAKLELESAATAKTLVVTAKYNGTYGNAIKLVVETVSTESRLIIQNSEGETLEASPLQAKASELFTWGETHTTYVTITQGSGYTTGKTEKLKAITATKLASGANPTVNEKTTIKSIEAFGKGLGPGTLIVPGNSEEKVHTAMAEHCLTSKNNRFAFADLKEAEKAGTTAATLIGEKGTYAQNIAGNIAFTSSSCMAAGLTLGTTRTIPGSAVAAGLCAQVSATGNVNQAPAGREWSLAPFVTGFTNTYSEANMELLAESGINPFAERLGVPCLFDFVTALSRTKDVIFCQASASRERMSLVAASEEVGERFLFVTLDGRHQKRAKFQGELQGIIKRHWETNSLYGETATEAGRVEVGEPINTLATEQNGELNAEIVVRISPYAEVVRIAIVSKPITEAA